MDKKSVLLDFGIIAMTRGCSCNQNSDPISKDKVLRASKINRDDLEDEISDTKMEKYRPDFLKFTTGGLSDTPKSDYIANFLSNENYNIKGDKNMESLIEKYLLGEEDMYDESPVGDEAGDPEDPEEDGIYSDEDYDNDTLPVDDDGSIEPKKSLIDPMTGKNKPAPTNVKEVFSFTYDIATSLLDELAIVDDIGVNESEVIEEFSDLICITNMDEHEALKEGITMSIFTGDPVYIKRAFRVLESELLDEEEANQGSEKLKDKWEGIKKGGGEAKKVAGELQDKKYFASKKDIAEAFKTAMTEEFQNIFNEEFINENRRLRSIGSAAKDYINRAGKSNMSIKDATKMGRSYYTAADELRKVAQSGSKQEKGKAVNQIIGKITGAGVKAAERKGSKTGAMAARAIGRGAGTFVKGMTQ